MLRTTIVPPEQACAIWDQYVQSHPNGSGYQLMAWRRVMEDAFGHPTFYLMVSDEDQTVHGVLPLVFASGAGSEVRHVMGVTVLAGMLGVTFFGLFFTPVFDVVIRNLAERRARRKQVVVQGAAHA